MPELQEEIDSLVETLEAAKAPPGTAAFAFDVVKMIEAEHPEWLGMNKKELCRASIRRFIERHGGRATDSLVNVMTELAVIRWKAEPGSYREH